MSPLMRGSRLRGAGGGMRALALDFDGVISDSAIEAFVVALHTFAALRPMSRMAQIAATLTPASGDSIQRHRVYRDFVSLMPLGNRAEDFGVVLGILESGLRVDDQAAYDAQRVGESPDFLDRFHECFYQERARLQRDDPRAWVQLMSPYRPIVELLRRHAGDVTLCIATAKDRPSVELLLDAYGIADLFPDDLVIDKDHGVTKRAHLGTLQQRLGVEFSEITFVDDKVNHLDDVSGLGVRCALASWGYNGEREQRLALAAGYLVCRFDDVERKLYGMQTDPVDV